MRMHNSIEFFLFVGVLAFLRLGAAATHARGQQVNEPPDFLRKITDGGDFGRPKLGKGYEARLYPSQLGDRMSIHVVFRDEENAVFFSYHAKENEVIASFGLLYRVTSVKEKQCTIEWIRPWESPTGLCPRADSMIVPLEKTNRGAAAFRDAVVRFVSVANGSGEKKGGVSANVSIYVASTFEKRGAEWEATVKAGDIVLINEKGHKVRAVVPPDEKTKIFGWVELDAKSIFRADLVRNKTPFVEPKLKKKAIPPVQILTIKIRRHQDGPVQHGIAAIVQDPSVPKGVAVVELPGYLIQFPRFEYGDIVALGGFLYRYHIPPQFSDMPPRPPELRWIEDRQMPEGLASPSDGSMFVPLQKAGIGGMVIKRDGAYVASLCFLRHEQKGKSKEVVATMISGTGDDKLTPTTLEFVVKAGDYLLIAGKGYQVRTIVPDQKDGVCGWVELDANGTPEADLVRDKIQFVRPTPK